MASIERICCKEENYFLDKVAKNHPDEAKRLRYDFNFDDWNNYYNTSRWKITFDELLRTFRN